MNNRYFVSYHARCINGSFGLMTTPEDEKTPEGIKRVIDRNNKKAKDSDHKPEQYQIIRTCVQLVTDDNGVFVCRSVFDTVVEVYPSEPDKTPRYSVRYFKPNYSVSCMISSFDKMKAINCCNNNVGTYVVDESKNKVIFDNFKE